MTVLVALALPDPATATLGVNTLSELKALPTRPGAVSMAGSTTANDGGGGLFDWAAGDTTTADDALVVQPTSGPPGRYKRIYSGAIPVKFFGAKGDGVTDDTAAVQAAINAAFASGGGSIDFTAARCLIDSASLVVKKGVYLVGPWRNLGEANVNYSGIQSALIVNSAYTISLNDTFCGIFGLAILRKGLTTPTNARTGIDLVRSFSGTAITMAGGFNKASDCWLSNLFIGGFNQAIFCSDNERPRFEYISGDNTNGIYLKNCTDMNYLSNCHFWPFLVAHQPWDTTSYPVSGAANNGAGLIRITTSAANILTTGDSVTLFSVGGVPNSAGRWTITVIDSTHFDLQGSTFAGAFTSGGTVYLSAWYRSGVAYNFDGTVDWGQAETCFSFGYATGFRVYNSNNVTLTNIGADNDNPAQDTSSVGILITGTSGSASLVGCKTAAQGVNIKIDTTASAQGTVVVTNHRSWGAVTYALQVSHGSALMVNSMIQTGNVVRVEAAAAGLKFLGGDLTGASFSYATGAPQPSIVGTVGTAAEALWRTNGVNGNRGIAGFEGVNSTPTNGDTIYKYYGLTNSAGVQKVIAQESYRISNVTSGAEASYLYWSLISGGASVDTMLLAPTSLSPVGNAGMGLGSPTLGWNTLCLASGAALNWNNSAYTITQGGPTLTFSGNIISNTAVLSSGATNGVGYFTGAGGVVTQAASKSTGVTLNKASGAITMQAAALAAAAKVSFVVTNSAVAATDGAIVWITSGGTANAYRAEVTAVAAGSFTITVENITAGSLSEAPVVGFALIKAVTS